MRFVDGKVLRLEKFGGEAKAVGRFAGGDGGLADVQNRARFEDVVPETEAALARAVRYQHTFSLILADVDMFKNINDTHGHAMGDQVLRDIAEELRRQTRDGDIIARFGGEEFAIALPNTDLDGARLLASRVRASVAALGWETVDGETWDVGTYAGMMKHNVNTIVQALK